jgi:hypothetical protein
LPNFPDAALAGFVGQKIVNSRSFHPDRVERRDESYAKLNCQRFHTVAECFHWW